MVAEPVGAGPGGPVGVDATTPPPPPPQATEEELKASIAALQKVAAGFASCPQFAVQHKMTIKEIDAAQCQLQALRPLDAQIESAVGYEVRKSKLVDKTKKDILENEEELAELTVEFHQRIAELKAKLERQEKYYLVVKSTAYHSNNHVRHQASHLPNNVQS